MSAVNLADFDVVLMRGTIHVIQFEKIAGFLFGGIHGTAVEIRDLFIDLAKIVCTCLILGEDRAFPDSQAGKESKREFSETMAFMREGWQVVVLGENQFGGSVEVSRRGPGGLGVKGNGDRNAAGEGTTSGNRVNNGEALVFQFLDSANAPVPVNLQSITIDRIVRDTENFPDAGPTGYSIMAGGEVIAEGELSIPADSNRGGPLTIEIEAGKPITEARITNGAPFHPIANRFRVTAVTVAPADH